MTLEKICDNTSVGMIVNHPDRKSIAILKRAKFPFGYACPAGHIDGDENPEKAAQRELKEEVGLDGRSTTFRVVYEGRKENPCRRQGGNWHHWTIFRAEATSSVIVRSEDETVEADWYTQEQIQQLAKRTQQYIDGLVTEQEWEEDPGLEPIWFEFLEGLGIVASEE